MGTKTIWDEEEEEKGKDLIINKEIKDLIMNKEKEGEETRKKSKLKKSI